MDRRTVTIALGAGIGAIVGVAITDVSHLTGYWPHVVVAIGAAAGAILVPLIENRASRQSQPTLPISHWAKRAAVDGAFEPHPALARRSECMRRLAGADISPKKAAGH